MSSPPAILVSVAALQAATQRSKTSFLLRLRQAARRASRRPTPTRETRACLGAPASPLNPDKAANAGNKFQTGNNRPKCSGPPFWFETTALEMPAGVLDPHLRTGDVALVSTTDENCSNVYCCKGSRLLTDPALHLKWSGNQRLRLTGGFEPPRPSFDDRFSGEKYPQSSPLTECVENHSG
jgi:hypothetical protein